MKTCTVGVCTIAVCLTACGKAPSDTLGIAERSKFGLDEPTTPPPNEPQCTDVNTTWSAAATQQEQKFLPLINALRAQGATCGDKVMAPTTSLAPRGRLQCAARWHAQDMGERGFFSHNSPEGTRASDRLRAVGYKFRFMGENIAWGQSTAEGVMQAWTRSAAHCANMMDPDFTDMGVGYFIKDPNAARGYLWALDLGAPLKGAD